MCFFQWLVLQRLKTSGVIFFFFLVFLQLWEWDSASEWAENRTAATNLLLLTGGRASVERTTTKHIQMDCIATFRMVNVVFWVTHSRTGMLRNFSNTNLKLRNLLFWVFGNSSIILTAEYRWAFDVKFTRRMSPLDYTQSELHWHLVMKAKLTSVNCLSANHLAIPVVWQFKWTLVKISSTTFFDSINVLSTRNDLSHQVSRVQMKRDSTLSLNKNN